MYKTAKKWVVIILTIALISMSLLAILAIWDVFDDDIAWKALSTLGVVLTASAISLVIIKIIDDRGEGRTN
jgi:hypothetical protein